MTTDNSAVIARLERQRDELAEALREIVAAYETESIGGVDTRTVVIGKKALASLDSDPAKQPADPEQQPSIYWVLFDATTERPYIKKLRPGSSLAFFDNESDAKRAKQNNPGTNYKRVDYYKAPQPPAEQPVIPERWTIERHGTMYLIQKHDDLGCFLKGVWVYPAHYGHVICELLSDMAQQKGRE